MTTDLIPGFSLYRIDRKGRVLNTETGEILEGSINPEGYCHYRLKSDSGEINTIGRHRLLGMTYFPTENYQSLYINHIDGVKGNDVLSNLEWVTPKQNVEHAGRLGITPKCLPVEVRDERTTEVFQFPSVKACADYFEMSRDEVHWRLKHAYRSAAVWPEGRRYRYRQEEFPEWPKLVMHVHGRNVSVQLRHRQTGEVLTFINATAAADFLNIGLQAIMARLDRTGAATVYPEGYQIRRETDEEWPVPSKVYGSKRGVVVTDVMSGAITTYESAVECSRSLGVRTTTLNWRLKCPDKVYGKYKFSYSPSC